ncbi:hypothetical protein ACM64Y_11110 [Novispirillum sp. DQ9]|uniref:hypothetical protein n=1 Tax=Novispirillum sp. DQ9 TaxID=3398612 RepID=UPI003C7B27A1
MSKVVMLPQFRHPEPQAVPDGIGLIAEHLVSLRDLALMGGHMEVAHFIDVAAAAAAAAAEAKAAARRKGEEH